MSERRSWAIGAGVGSVWMQLRSAWARLPPHSARRWTRAIVFGGLLTAGLMLALTLLTRRWVGQGLQAWDRALLERIAGLERFSFQQAVWWEAYGASSFLIPVTLLAVVLAARSQRPLLAATFAAGYLLARPIIFTGWGVWDRARPDLVAGGIAAPPLHSFPSGHTVQTAALYGLMTFLWIRRSRSRVERCFAVLAWALLVFLVSFARLRMGVHWPSDVIGGALVGTAWAATLITALRRAEAAGGR